MTAAPICVVTVTYGDRWHLLRRVLVEGLAAQTRPVDCLVIVDNGSASDLRSETRSLGLPFRVVIAGTGANLGSAAGYKAGIEAGLALDCGLLWLLDDDNLPAPDALERLLQARSERADHPLHAFASFRSDREKLVRVLQGQAMPDPVRRDAFMGFRAGDLGRILRRRLRGPRPKDAVTPLEVAPIPYSIYGGLLLPASLVARIGLPDETYHLYMDDREYTVRIPMSGGAIFLVAASVVTDIETSWNIRPGAKPLPMMDPAMPEDKVYYTTRNQVAFERKYSARTLPLYFANMSIFMASALARGFLQNRSLVPTLSRFRLLLGAVTDGWAGRMGPRARGARKPAPLGG